jgi:hypothetical protein
MKRLFAASLLMSLASQQLSAGQVVVPVQLQDKVTCIYDAMTPEQREIVQTLLLQNMETDSDPFGDGPNAKEIKASLEDAMNSCVDQYAWSSGKTNGAMGYALFTLMVEALGPLLEADGVVLADIDAYITAKKSGFRLPGPPSKAMIAELFSHLAGKGWKLDNEKIKENAELYFSLQLGREAMRRLFAQNVTYRK